MFLLTPRVLSPAVGGIGATESARQAAVPAPARKPRLACRMKHAAAPVAVP
jgi:hypothetical protein